MQTLTFHHLKPRSITTIAINITEQIKKRLSSWGAYTITCSFMTVIHIQIEHSIFTLGIHSVPRAHIYTAYI